MCASCRPSFFCVQEAHAVNAGAMGNVHGLGDVPKIDLRIALEKRHLLVSLLIDLPQLRTLMVTAGGLPAPASLS
jgi:hypothetical protein